VRQNPKSGDLIQKAGSASVRGRIPVKRLGAPVNSTEGECATMSTKSTKMSTVKGVVPSGKAHWERQRKFAVKV